MKNISRLVRAALLLGLLSTPAMAATPGCDEACLLGIAGDFLDALTANDPSTAPFAPQLRATENGIASAPGQGIWKTATAWSYRHTIVDPVSGGIAVFGTVMEADNKKAIVAVRLKVADRRIAESELMVSREGDFSLFDTQTTEVRSAFTDFVPPEQRSTRAALAAIAHSYLTGLTRGDPSAVPFHPDCNRFENGVQTTNSPPHMLFSCAEGLHRFGYMQSFRDLRFPVIDPQRGLVLAVVAFDLPVMNRTLTLRGKPYEISPDRQHLPRTLFLNELFKIEGGKIRAVEAEMRNMPLGTQIGWSGVNK